jgi:hypothetical protein
VVGTPQYIAPEVWEDKPATAQTDVYALGCILYEMVMGERLFQGDTTPAVMRAHFQPVELPETWPEEVPPGLGEVLRTALAKEPEERYARAGDLADTLDTIRQAGPPEMHTILKGNALAEDAEPGAMSRLSTEQGQANLREATPQHELHVSAHASGLGEGRREIPRTATRSDDERRRPGASTVLAWLWVAGIVVLSVLAAGFVLLGTLRGPVGDFPTSTEGLPAAKLSPEVAPTAFDGLIAFRTNRDGNEEIYVMNADGTGQADLSNNPAYDGVSS